MAPLKIAMAPHQHRCWCPSVPSTGAPVPRCLYITTLGTQPALVRRRTSRYAITISSESEAKMRCRIRKQLFVQRVKIADWTFFAAIFGILLMIVDTELTAMTEMNKSHYVSHVLRSLCVISTLILLMFVFLYHAIEVKIALIDSGADDWRVAVTTGASPRPCEMGLALPPERIFKLMIEFCVCSICPLPGTGYMWWPYMDIEISPRAVRLVKLPVDVLLSVPMFCRMYLLCRFMVLHSRQFQDAATRSIAALNRISMDFRFVAKTLLSEHPLRALLVFTVAYWTCMSWMFTQCERYIKTDGQADAHTYLNAAWFTIVTFMSIGYGDVVPHTHCGRALSIATGVVGAGVSSALIAIMSRKLELTRAEKHVNNFMSDSKLTTQRKNAAAAVLQQTWFIHKYKRNAGASKTDDLKIRYHQRKFLQAINEFRRIKWDQRKLAERGHSLLDIGKMHAEMHETLWEVQRTQADLAGQVDALSQRIVQLHMLLATGGLTITSPQQSQQAVPAMAAGPAGHVPVLEVDDGQGVHSGASDMLRQDLQQRVPLLECDNETNGSGAETSQSNSHPHDTQF